jgi:hypothetical protein
MTTRHLFSRPTSDARSANLPAALFPLLLLVLLSVSCTPVQSAKSPAPSSTNSAVSVKISPTTANLSSSNSLQFAATVSQASNTAVTWSASAGTISDSGFFVAPSVSSQTSVTITATSVQQSTAKANATITIAAPSTTLPLSVITSSLPAATNGSNYSFHLSASGGVQPYEWLVVSGQVPGVTLTSDGMLSGTATQTGQFNFTAQVSDSASHQVQQAFSLVVQQASGGGGGGGSDPSGIPSTFFGLHIDWKITPWPNVSFGARRLWDTETGWAQINTALGVYDWTTMDSVVNTALANNVDLLYDFGRTPGWGQCASNDVHCGSGNTSAQCNYNTAFEGGPGQCFPPKDLNVDGTGSDQIWITWVTAVASRYKGQIKYYEVWNEPDDSVMWQGTNQQLVRMAQDAHCVVVGTGCSSLSTYTQTGIDPAAQITTPAYVSMQGITAAEAMNGYMQAGGGSYVDVIAYHGYVQWPSPAEQVASDLADLQSTLASANQSSKPIFSTEGGYGAKQTITDPDQEASWISRYLMVQQSAGIVRSYWYAWDAATTPFWTPSQGTIIGGTTYGEVINWLVGATLSSPCAASGTVWQCGYTRPNGYKAIAVWDTSQTCHAGNCTTSNFSVPEGYTYSQDLSGAKTSIAGTTVEIGLKPILLENQ